MYERRMIVADWIIIVDDNAADLQTAESALKNIGINTTVLKTGRELLDYLQQSASVPAGFKTPSRRRKNWCSLKETP